MRTLTLTVFGLALLAVAPAPASAAGGVAAAPAVKPLTTAEREAQRADFRAGLVKGGGELMRWAMDTYPDEFRGLENELIDGVHNGTLTMSDAMTRAFEFSTGIRARAMAFVLKAPASDVRAMVKEQVALLHYFRGVNLKACYEFGETGGLTQDTVSSLSAESITRMAAYSSYVVKAVDAGRRTPVERSPLRESDYPPLVDAYTDRGGNPKWLVATSSGDFSNILSDERCDSVITFLEVVVDLPDETLGRFIATK